MSRQGHETPEERAKRARRQLGRFLRPVEDFIDEMAQIEWFVRGGIEDPWDSEVIRITEAAEADKRYGEFIGVTTAVWKALDALGDAFGRLDAMRAAEDLWIVSPTYANAGPPEAESLLTGPVRDDIVGALKELILDDVVPIRFYRDAIDWYKRGHWRCAITTDGKRVVW